VEDPKAITDSEKHF